MSALLDQSVIGGLLLHAAVVLSVGIIWPAAHQRLLLPLADSGGTIIRRGRPACPDVPGMPSACTPQSAAHRGQGRSDRDRRASGSDGAGIGYGGCMKAANRRLTACCIRDGNPDEQPRKSACLDRPYTVPETSISAGWLNVPTQVRSPAPCLAT